MATNNRGGNRGSRGRNNNPEGRNQYSGMMSTARDNPIATAAAVGGAVAAGVFLWSRRSQISDQISNLSDQMGSSSDFSDNSDIATEPFMASATSGKRGKKSQAEISEEALTLKETGKATA